MNPIPDNHLEDPSKKLRMLSAIQSHSSEKELAFKRIVPFLLFRIVFIILTCTVILIGAIFSRTPPETLGSLAWIEAILWLICAMSAPLMLYRDPSILVKALACVCIIAFSIEYLYHVW